MPHHTPRTPEFLGLDTESRLWAGHSTQDLNQASNDVIIEVLDTGVWPESKSFNNTGMPEVPTKWRGQCESAPDFGCYSLQQEVNRSSELLQRLSNGLRRKQLEKAEGSRVPSRHRRSRHPHVQHRH
ncbi:hypothetical protein ACFX13_046600 [Malus domestica]